MSYNDYKKALNLMEQNKELRDDVGKRPLELIKKAEQKLNLKFPKSYKNFLKKFGTLSFGSEEIYGVINDDFDNSGIPDAIWYTLLKRKQVQMPEGLLIIYVVGNGELMCLDFSNVNLDGEPAVVVFVPGVDLEYQTYEKVANDFGEFLLELVETELSYKDQ